MFAATLPRPVPASSASLPLPFLLLPFLVALLWAVGQQYQASDPCFGCAPAQSIFSLDRPVLGDPCSGCITPVLRAADPCPWCMVRAADPCLGCYRAEKAAMLRREALHAVRPCIPC